METVELVFETHSITEDNERGVATGWLGGRLSSEGRRKAAELGRRRRNDGISVVFSSDLNRAVETVQIAFDGSGIPVFLDWRLRECNYGAMNGMPSRELEAQRPRRLDEPFPGGETWREAVARVISFVDELVISHRSKRVLLIGHVATRWALDHYVLGRSLNELVACPFHWQEGWEYRLRPHRET